MAPIRRRTNPNPPPKVVEWQKHPDESVWFDDTHGVVTEVQNDGWPLKATVRWDNGVVSTDVWQSDLCTDIEHAQLLHD